MAWLKMSLPLPTSFRISREGEQHVLAGLDRLVIHTRLAHQGSAISSTCFAVTFAAFPVDLMTASVCAPPSRLREAR